VQLLGAADPGAVDGAAEDVDGAIVGLAVDGEGVAVLAAVGEGEAGGVAEGSPGAVDEVGGEGEGAHGLGADAFRAQELLKVLRVGLVGLAEGLFQALGADVGEVDVVVGGELQGLEAVDLGDRLLGRLVGEAGGDQDDLSAPKSDARIEQKFRGLTEEFLGTQRVDAILDRLWNLEKLGNVAEIPAAFVLG